MTDTSSPNLERVMEAFEGEGGQMRTLGGIVRDTQMDKEQVLSILESHPDVFTPAAISPPGSPVFALRSEASDSAVR